MKKSDIILDMNIMNGIRTTIMAVNSSGAGAYMKVHIKDNNGFLVSDWRVFYNCLYELVKLFDDERNTMALKIWNKDYNSLSFQEKAKIVDLVGYRINIEFK